MTKSVYFAHPFSTMEWGFEFTKKLQALGIIVVDPFVRPQQAELNKVEEKNRNAQGQVVGTTEFTYEQCKDIVEMDLIKVRQQSAVVAVVNGDDSKGTHMEAISAAKFYGMPLFTLYTQKGRIHPWYRYLSRIVARTEEELLVYLKDWVESGKEYGY